MRGRMPVNILTWPRLTFLARRQTLVYPRLFIKHTLIINKTKHFRLRISESPLERAMRQAYLREKDEEMSALNNS